MARLYRLTVAALLALFFMPVHALVPQVSGYESASQCVANVWYFGSTFTASAQAVATALNGCNGSNSYTVETVGTTATGYKLRRQDGAFVFGATRAAQQCPANSTLSGAQCQCASGYMEDPTHTSCVVRLSELEQFCQSHAAAKNPFNQTGTIGSASALPSASCYKPYPPFEGPDAVKGCQMTLNNTVAAPREGDPLLRDWSATGVATGATCTDEPATDAQPKANPDPCPDGFPGSLNGTTVCIKREPDKGIEGVQGTETKNADGTSTTTKETTKCNAGICTTTKETTNRDATGAIIGTVKVDEKKETIGAKCNADPGNKICASTGTGVEGGGGLTGNCVAGFVIKGEDPILNAMALEQHKRNCEVLRTDAEPSTWATAEGQKTGNVMADSPNNAEFSIGSGSFDTSDALGGGGCSLNKTVSVRGYSVALPFNVLCDPLAIFGQILVAFAFLLGARIVTRG